jgi:hypothetical protein
MKYIKYGIIAVTGVAALAVLLKTDYANDALPVKPEPAPALSSQQQVTALPPVIPTQAQLSSVSKPTSTKSSVRSRSEAAAADRLEAMQKRRPDRKFDSAEVLAAMERKTVWSTAKDPAKDLPLEPEEKGDGRQFINFDSLKLETLMPGDTVTVGIDETSENYEVIVDRVEKHDYDSITWHGHIDGRDGQTYTVSFTRGKHLTVGGLSTPDGHYVLQAHGNNGWVASSARLFKSDPDVPDAIYPHEEELTEASHTSGGH